MITKLQEDRARIREIQMKHKKDIGMEWTRLLPSDREALLRQVDPDMYPYRWGEGRFCAEYRDGYDLGTEMRRFRSWNLHPDMNLEELSQDANQFLRLLENRAKFSPAAWAAYDSIRLNLPWALGGFELLFNSHCVVLHDEGYSKMVLWEPARAHSWEIVGFPRTSLIIESQTHRMSILRGVGQLLCLTSIPPTIGKNTSDKKTLVLNKVSYEDTFSKSIGLAFGPLPKLSFASLVSISQTISNKLFDHVNFLKTDELYMRDYVEQLKVTYELFMSGRQQTLWVISDLADDVHTSWIWKWISEEANLVQGVYESSKKDVRRGAPLPEDLASALARFKMMVTHFITRLRRNLFIVKNARPGFIERSKQEISEPNRFKEDPLSWCLNQLIGDPDDHRAFDHSLLFEFLKNNLSTCTPKNRKRLDSILLRKFSCLASLHQLWAMVLVGRPRAPRENLIEFIGRPDRTDRWQQRLTFLGCNNANLEFDWVRKKLSKHLEDIEATRTPSSPDDPSNIPDPQERFWQTLEGIEKDPLMPKAGEQFSLNPEYFRGLWDEPSDQSAEVVPAIADIAKGLDLVPRSDGEATFLDNDSRFASDIAPSSDTEDSVLALSDLTVNTTETTSSTDAKLTKYLHPAPTAPTARLSPGTRVGRRVAVNKHAYDTFEKLLSGSTSAQKISWHDFLYAMGQVNFHITTGSGSLVNFTSATGSKWAGRPTIGFDKPHPPSGWSRSDVLSVGMTLKARLEITINTFILV